MQWIGALALLFMLAVCGRAAADEMPPIHAGHPRMAFAPATAKSDAARLQRSPFWKDFATRARAHLDATNDNSPRALADTISQGGLLALATGDAAIGKKTGDALDRLSRIVETGGWKIDDDLAQGILLTDIAFGYDWAYPYLSPAQRKRGAQTLVTLANYSKATFSGYFQEGSYSAFNNHTIWNHVGVGAAGFASAGDHPDGRALAAFSYGWFTRIFLPTFARWVGPNGTWNEGTHYNQVAFKPTFLWMAAAGPALGKNFFDTPWVRASAYYWVYLTRADDTMTILGDWFADRQPDTVTNLHARTFWITSRAASASRDGHLQAFAQRQLAYALRRAPEVWNLVWYDPDLPARPVSELPPSRLFQATGPAVGGGETLAVLRSGWGPDARLITFSMGDWLGHHDHYDSNSFSIHYKEDLALDPGYGGEKDIDWTYYRRTYAHNSLLVPVPEAQAIKDEPALKERGWGYDGGQRVPLVRERPRNPDQFFAVKNPEYPDKSLFETGNCVAFETHPTYDYVAGDATRAYFRSQLTRWVRHLVFLKPDILVVYDVIETPPGRQPRWLLQTLNKPLGSNGLLIAPSGPAELRVQTLLPAHPNATFHPTPATLPFGPQTTAAPLYRTEITAPVAGTEHRFLHVLHIADKDAPQRIPSRFSRDGDRLRVQVGTGSGAEQVFLRWDGKPGVEVRQNKAAVAPVKVKTAAEAVRVAQEYVKADYRKGKNKGLRYYGKPEQLLNWAKPEVTFGTGATVFSMSKTQQYEGPVWTVHFKAADPPGTPPNAIVLPGDDFEVVVAQTGAVLLVVQAID